MVPVICSDLLCDLADKSDQRGQRRATGWYQGSSAGQKYRRIWIEWKQIEPQHPHKSQDDPNPATLKRFKALVALLHKNDVTSQFRAPKCLGYFFRKATRDVIQYGLIFKNPTDVSPSTAQPHYAVFWVETSGCPALVPGWR